MGLERDYTEVKEIEDYFLHFKVSEKKYFEVMNFLKGIKKMDETGKELTPYFICKEGVIYFLIFPDSKNRHILLSKNLNFSDDENKNKILKDSLESMLKN